MSLPRRKRKQRVRFTVMVDERGDLIDKVVLDETRTYHDYPWHNRLKAKRRFDTLWFKHLKLLDKGKIEGLHIEKEFLDKTGDKEWDYSLTCETSRWAGSYSGEDEEEDGEDDE